jgi:hypothetical protein
MDAGVQGKNINLKKKPLVNCDYEIFYREHGSENTSTARPGSSSDEEETVKDDDANDSMDVDNLDGK